MRFFVTIGRCLVKTPNKGAAEESARQTERGSGFGAHHQPAFGLPALPQRARGRRRPHDLVAGARRAVPSQRRADSQGPRLLRRVRRPRRRLLRPRSEAAPAPDPRARSQAARRDHGRRQSRARAGRLSRASARKGSRSAALFDTLKEKVGQQSRGGVPIYDIQRSEEGRAARGHQHRRDRRAGAVRPARSSTWSSPPASRRC